MDLKQKIFIYVDSPIACLSFTLILLTAIVLTRLQNSAKIFYFLKFESYFILVDCFFTTLLPTFICPTCFSNLNPIAACFLRFIGFNFLADTSEQTSIVLSIFASLTCLFILNAGGSVSSPVWWNFLNNIRPAFIAIFAFVFCAFIYGYELFAFQVIVGNFSNNFVNNQTKVFVTATHCEFVNFRNNQAIQIWSVFLYGFGYGVMLLGILVINIKIAIKVKRELIMGKKSLGLNVTTTKSNNRRKASERNLVILILVDSLNLVLGRVPALVHFFLYNIGVVDDFMSCLTLLAILVSYCFKFFIFYRFNKRFRGELKRMVYLVMV